MVSAEAIPASVHLLLDFLNTRYGQQKRFHDAWPDRAAMEGWLREQGLITVEIPVTEGDYRRAIGLREALRQTLQRSQQDAATAAEALETINQIARHTLLKVTLTHSGSVEALLIPESQGVDGVLARVVGAVYTAMCLGHWERLKVCQNTGCSRAFYDHSRNRTGVWCSTQTCGNRMHARTYRQQHRQAGNA